MRGGELAQIVNRNYDYKNKEANAKRFKSSAVPRSFVKNNDLNMPEVEINLNHSSQLNETQLQEREMEVGIYLLNIRLN